MSTLAQMFLSRLYMRGDANGTGHVATCDQKDNQKDRVAINREKTYKLLLLLEGFSCRFFLIYENFVVNNPFVVL